MQFRLPFIHQLRNYNRKIFTQDLVGGFTVGVMLIPQGMAYAYIADIPPVYGLYASIVPLLVYMLLGTSKYAAIGPAALTSLLVITGLTHAGITEEAEFLNAVFVISILSGLIQVLMGVFQLGKIVNFISKPVLKGFIFGAALTIFLSQVKSATGIQLEAYGSFSTLLELGNNISTRNLYTLLFSLFSIASLLYLEWLSKRIPNQLVVMFVTSGIVDLFSMKQKEFAIVGVCPYVLPSDYFLD